jgi:glutathione S-transferase
MEELVGLPYSPWSEKARWALDLRRVPYRFRTYMPLVGEPLLRVKLRKWTGTVTVPVMTCDDGRVLSDSADIARWADQRGDGPQLFPREHEAAVAHFIERSEAGLRAGRALALRRMLEDDEALVEMVPRALRRGLRPVAVRVGRLGIARTLRKYGALDAGAGEHERVLTGVLDELRDRLARASDTPRTLLGRLTFADVAMSQVLAFIAPPATGLRIGRASRRSFTDERLRARYADLVTWRDELYQRYRERTDNEAACASS